VWFAFNWYWNRDSFGWGLTYMKQYSYGIFLPTVAVMVSIDSFKRLKHFLYVLVIVAMVQTVIVGADYINSGVVFNLLISDRIGLDSASISYLGIPAWWAIAILISMTNQIAEREKILKRINYGIMLIAFLFILASGTRSILIGLFVSILYLWISSLKMRSIFRVIFIVIFISIIYIAVSNIFSTSSRMISAITDPLANDNMGFRVRLWQSTLEEGNWIRFLTLGYGPSQWGEFVSGLQWDDNSGRLEFGAPYRRNPENITLGLLTEFGLMGLISIAGIGVHSWKKMRLLALNVPSLQNVSLLLKAWFIFSIVRHQFVGYLPGTADLVIVMMLGFISDTYGTKHFISHNGSNLTI